ncbi:hypothetical protein EYZ11_009511 [Aspergillus tanneri]|uniref:Uncharacterized protein n=1 Tax=Aspergillus tanneri TaxID=1220188 RepID=A0A4S3J7R2_9EURO|nr:hypothetical protein EYZ11_009511 [Aspergillus tanneri]
MMKSTAPANEVLEWHSVEWASADGESRDGAHGDYVGEPRPVLEKAWGDIFDVMNVRISEEDLRAVERLEGAVALPDGGYVGSLNIFHELHCVWWMYKFVHADHYFEGATRKQHAIMKIHAHHCLNILRQSAMCHGDVGLITYNWNPDVLKPDATATMHQCANWDRITEWARARAVNITKPGVLVHPNLGTVFKEGDKEELAVGMPPVEIDPDSL